MAAYCMGSLNSDCWYMYTMKDFARPITSEPDQTIEILMSDLDTDIMDIFHQHTSSSAKEAREVIITSLISRYSVFSIGQYLFISIPFLQKSGIDQLVPNMKIDDFLFEPCGYSMNGVLLNVSKWLIDSSFHGSWTKT